MFHGLTGCDTESSFAGHGKKTAWANWTVLPEITDALLKLSASPSNIPEDVTHTIECFVILLYDRTSSCADIDKIRKKLFAKKNNVHLIPPTKVALEEHVKRAAYQGGHVWAKHCYQHGSCLNQPAGAGPSMRRVCTCRTGQDYPRQPTPAMF